MTERGSEGIVEITDNGEGRPESMTFRLDGRTHEVKIDPSATGDLWGHVEDPNLGTIAGTGATTQELYEDLASSARGRMKVLEM